jgi:peptidoglycan glycosyltransferase
MNRAIRRVGIGVTVLVLLLVGQLTYLQVYDADNLANDPRNIRFQLRDFSKPRGRILTADGQIVARSVETGDELKFQRL